MVQPPWQVDVLQIVGDSGLGTRTISDDIPTGSLRFADNQIPGGVNLYELIGIQQVGGVLVIGRSGSGRSKDANGDPIDTIQGANDAIPLTSAVDQPWVVLVGPGEYLEEAVLDRDYVTYFALGDVLIRNVNVGTATVTVAEGPFTIPRHVTFKGIRIESTGDLDPCVEITSATYATMTITVAKLPCEGDTVTIDGTTLTAVLTHPVGVGEFKIGPTTELTAMNLAAAINNIANGLTTTVKAFVTGSVITIRAFALGTAGNGIPISTSVPATFVLSDPTTVGGMDAQAGSEVGEDRISFVECELIPLGATPFHLRATAINNIYVDGGDWIGSSTGATFEVNEIARLEMVNVSNIVRMQTHYDNANLLPIIVGSSYKLRNLSVLSDCSAELMGDGSLTITGCEYASGSDLNLAGDRFVRADNSKFGNIMMGETIAMDTRNCSREVLTLNPGTPTFSETLLTSSVSFAASASEVFTFDIPQPDTSYRVSLETTVPPLALTDIPYVATKTPDSFMVVFNGAQTTTVGITVSRS